MGGVGCRPSGRASLPERKKRKVVARTSIWAMLVLRVVLWNNFNQSVEDYAGGTHNTAEGSRKAIIQVTQQGDSLATKSASFEVG